MLDGPRQSLGWRHPCAWQSLGVAAGGGLGWIRWVEGPSLTKRRVTVRASLMAGFIVFAVGCYAHAAGTPRSVPSREAVDAQVMGACLDTVAAEVVRDAVGAAIGGPRTQILILPRSRRSDGFLSAEQLESELPASEWESVALLAEAVRNRGASVQPILVPSARQPTRLLDNSELSAEPKTPWVEFYLPGYSTDDRSALVRAHFGPTPHDATFTCLVTLEHGSWAVRWSKVSYFA